MQTKIFHTVNSGLIFYNNETCLLVDAIHQGHSFGFSPMPKNLVNEMKNHSEMFNKIDGIIFTHLHTDHFDSSILHEIIDTLNPPVIYGPNIFEENSNVFADKITHIKIKNFDVLAINTIHDGKHFVNDPHQSYLINAENEQFFVAGDAILTEYDAKLLMCNTHLSIDIAFLNVYQLSSESGHNFLQLIRPKKIFLYHLPFPEDDHFNYRALAKQLAKKNSQVEIIQPMGWIII